MTNITNILEAKAARTRKATEGRALEAIGFYNGFIATPVYDDNQTPEEDAFDAAWALNNPEGTEL
jgi:ribosomal protein S16